METTIAVEQTEPEVRLRKFTIAEYYKMAEAGILAWKERVELLDGHILQMAPIGDRLEDDRYRVTTHKGEAISPHDFPDVAVNLNNLF